MTKSRALDVMAKWKAGVLGHAHLAEGLADPAPSPHPVRLDEWVKSAGSGDARIAMSHRGRVQSLTDWHHRMGSYAERAVAEWSKLLKGEAERLKAGPGADRGLIVDLNRANALLLSFRSGSVDASAVHRLLAELAAAHPSALFDALLADFGQGLSLRAARPPREGPDGPAAS